MRAGVERKRFKSLTGTLEVGMKVGAVVGASVGISVVGIEDGLGDGRGVGTPVGGYLRGRHISAIVRQPRVTVDECRSMRSGVLSACLLTWVPPWVRLSAQLRASRSVPKSAFQSPALGMAAAPAQPLVGSCFSCSARRVLAGRDCLANPSASPMSLRS